MSAATPKSYAQALAALCASGASASRLSAAVDVVADELMASGRGKWLRQVLAAFEEAVDAQEGRQKVIVETPHALTAADRTRIAKALGRDASTLRLTEHIRASAQAGWSIRSGDRMIANTVADRLAKLFA